jgi:hypothetical protein
MSTRDDLLAKIKVLNKSIWDHRAQESTINAWLDNVAAPNGSDPDERLHALYLLSHFMYFGGRQMRELMRVLFRDLFKYPLIHRIRKQHADTTDLAFIARCFEAALDETLFLGVGNPSESGSHLLYYFRQENALPKSRFIQSHEIFLRQRPTLWQLLLALLTNKRDRIPGTFGLRQPRVSRYVFIDDFCGSGHQGQAYSRGIVEDIKSIAPSVEVWYFVLIATSTGVTFLRDHTAFDAVECIFELDDSFKCFSPASRYFPSHMPEIDRGFAENMCRGHGGRLLPGGPLGYDDCQLLLGFHHNTPDNSLPIFWYDEPGGVIWNPMFRRYPKNYG